MHGKEKKKNKNKLCWGGGSLLRPLTDPPLLQADKDHPRKHGLDIEFISSLQALP
jgi:hypothetical protein